LLQTEDFRAFEGELSLAILQRRKEQFQTILYSYVNDLHSVYLAEKGIKNFDPFTLKTWHSGFDLNKIQEIPSFLMKEAPSLNLVTLREMKKHNSNSLVNDALDLLIKINPPKETPKKKDDDLKSILSSELIRKVINFIRK
jgi:hypothetical protein